MLTDTVLLGLVGGAAAMLVAVWGASLLPPIFAVQRWNLLGDFETGRATNAVMLLFAVAISVVAGLLAGVVPALQATRGNLFSALKQGEHGSGGGRQYRLRKILVSVEVGLTLLLLVGSTLLLRSFMALQNVNTGMDPRGVLVAELSLGAKRYDSSAAMAQFQRSVLERVRALPGVRAAGTVSAIPGRRDLNLGVNGGDCAGAEGAIQYRAVSASYFETVGIPLRSGRLFTDGEAAPVTIVNEAFARKSCWKGQDPKGRQVWMGKGLGDVPRQVVGIVGDTHDYGPSNPATPTIFVPQWQVPEGIIHLTNTVFYWSIVVRAADTEGVGPSIARAIREVDPEQPVVTVVPLDAILGGWLKSSRGIMELMSAFAGLAVLLTAIGLYGVLGIYVTQRTREIGIRVALGATQRHVLRMVIGEGVLLVGVGAALGIAAAFASARLIKSLLFQVKAADPWTFLVATLFLLLVAGLACYVPARRAMRVDPMVALRYE
jgi:putative ABC transport system permease protein